MRKPKFIVLEGIDGVGKGTQMKLLGERLRKAGVRFTSVSSPRYKTPTGQLVKRALHGEFGDFVGLNAYLAATPYFLDFAAARADLVAALKKGVVISDRYVSSTSAYHAAKLPQKERKAFLDLVDQFMFREFKLPKPDLVLYLDMPVARAQKNLRGKKKDQYEKNVGYQRRVAQVYLQLAKRKGWRVVPCVKNGRLRSPEEVHELVWKAVQ
ncbi:MAG TPA: thymidylate kinase [Candidatus Paceibacterota bacterium]|jgi:dTMP kinase|nr:thymidylate kinase [Candidatus Paceibacterota bacterium]